MSLILTSADRDSKDISRCLNALLPNPTEILVKNNDEGVWHYCCRQAAVQDTCQRSIKLKLVGENELEVQCISVQQDSLTSQLVHQIFEIVSRDSVSWPECLVQFQALRDRWISQAKIWKATRRASETLQKEFIKMRNLKQSDVKILDFWASSVN